MRPRKFYLGFGPPLVKTMRGGVEYGIAAFPLGGYVKIPGMYRPAAGDLRKSLPAGRPGGAARAAGRARRGDRARTTSKPRARSCRQLEAAPREEPHPPGARRRARPRCVLAPDHVEADRRDRRRAAHERPLRDRRLRGALHARLDGGDAHRRPRDRGTPGCDRGPAGRRRDPRRSPASRSRRTRSRARSTRPTAGRSRSSFAATASASSSGRSARVSMPAPTASASRSAARPGRASRSRRRPGGRFASSAR